MASLFKHGSFVLVLIVAIPFLAISESNTERSKSLLLSGVVLEQGHNSLLKEFTRWLGEKAAYPLTTHFTDSYQGLSNILRENPSAVAWTCGVPFVEDHATDHQQLIAVPLFNGAPVYHSLVMTRAGRTEKN